MHMKSHAFSCSLELSGDKDYSLMVLGVDERMGEIGWQIVTAYAHVQRWAAEL
jgi:hypothetical protein